MITTRFAPSPTGNLHIGGARTALFNWLYARHVKGRFILRIEDTDVERSKDEFTRDILEGLAWLGIDHDGEPLFQSARMDIYRQHAYRLVEKGLAYRCYCSPQLLEEKRKKAFAEGRKPSYDRACRDLDASYEGQPYVIRFKTPLTGIVSFTDVIRGEISFKAEELDDLIILRTDNTPTYNFTVVIDDALMEVTHVIRGDDHINNTPRQILLYKALGFQLPQFAHVPLIHGKDRSRLSKRHGATSLLEYRKDGFLPEALMNYLSRLGWAYGDQEIFTKAELIEKFELSSVGKSASVFNMEKLMWLNSHYMKALPLDEVADRLIPFIEEMGYRAPDRRTLTAVVVNLRERARTLKEMARMAEFFFSESVEFELKAKQKFLTPETRPILEEFLEGFRQLPNLAEQEQRVLVEKIAGGRGKKLAEVIQPLRVALSGREVTPGIFEVISILGRETVEKRISEAIASIA